MKKAILSLIVVAALSTSCKKDYNCVCTLNGTTSSTSTTVNGTKSSAQASCNALQTSGVTCAIQ
jgi:hypothetical protein